MMSCLCADVLLGRHVKLATFMSDTSYYQFHDVHINRAYHEPDLHRDCFESQSLDPSTYPPVCFQQAFFADDLRTMRHWYTGIHHWFAHMPHLWSRAGMAAVETKLAAELAIARRNKFRNNTIDVSMHLHYEARRRNQSRVPPLPVGVRKSIPVNVLEWVDPIHKSNPYVFAVFQQCQHLQLRQFFAHLECQMQLYNPQFVTLDDGLEMNPRDSQNAPNCLRDVQVFVNGFFRKHWPDPAPWEITATVRVRHHTCPTDAFHAHLCGACVLPSAHLWVSARVTR